MLRNRRGFVLLTVLWATAIASLLAAEVLALARHAIQLSSNRASQRRGAWARDACEELLAHRFAKDSVLLGLDTVELGGGLWCRASVEDPDARIDLNLANDSVLRAVVVEDSLLAALRDWQDSDTRERAGGAEALWYRSLGRLEPRNAPLESVLELRRVHGFEADGVERMAPLLTVDGTGRVNLNRAPASVLGLLPFLTPEVVRLIVARQRSRQPLAGPEDLLALLPPFARMRATADYPGVLRAVSFQTERVLVVSEGGRRSAQPVAHALSLYAAAGRRLALLRREVIDP